MIHSPGRRRFVSGLLTTPLTAISAGMPPAAASPSAPGSRLAPWTPGHLDIHHIATGRGDATFMMLPDGTSLLIDAGATNESTDVSVATRPNAERRAGEWIGRYLRRHLEAADRSGLDYFLLTHLHPDHVGDIHSGSPASTHGAYKLTGVMDVAEIVPIGTVVDRGYPNYDVPAVPTEPFALNYLDYVKARVSQGLAVERIRVGSDRQFRPRGHWPTSARFDVRNLVANGELWTGVGDKTRHLFPPLGRLASKDLPNENLCAAGVRVRSGNFSYFAAGDLTSYTYDGDLPWWNVLTAAARVCGPVDVAAAPHHGFFDGLSADSVRLLRPRAWVVNSWHVTHPDLQQLLRMTSERLYPGHRDVFATTVTGANLRANPWATSRLRSTDGHIVIRVDPGGDRFNIYVTDNTDEDDRVTLAVGPAASWKSGHRQAT